MTKKLVALAFSVLLCVGAATSGYAWDNEGHMMVAYVAYKKLTPTARNRANALLRLNPKYNDWLATLPAGTSSADKDMMIFMIAATWPDQIKKNPSYTMDGSDNGNRPDGSPDANRNTGYDDKLMHKYWHFVDKPFAIDATPLPVIPTPNVQDRIALFRSVLASNASDPLKSYDLSWLLHLVGDVHQPLHSSTRVDASNPGGDAGGNLVRLSCTGCPTELHAFWDNALGTSTDPKSAVRAAKKLPAPDPALLAKTGEAEWVSEGLQEAQQDVYISPIGAGLGPFPLTNSYKKAAKNLAQQRVALAGARLGNLINTELK